MITAKAYELYYTGMTKPQHLLRAVKSDMAGAAIDRTTNARLAEHFLRVLGFDKAVQAKAASFGMQYQDVSAIRANDYIAHIHQAKSDEIRGRFAQPEMTDAEAAEVLFDMILKDNLENAVSAAEPIGKV